MKEVERTDKTPYKGLYTIEIKSTILDSQSKVLLRFPFLAWAIVQYEVLQTSLTFFRQ